MVILSSLPSWYIIGLVFASHQGPTYGVHPRGGRQPKRGCRLMKHRVGFASGDHRERTWEAHGARQME